VKEAWYTGFFFLADCSVGWLTSGATHKQGVSTPPTHLIVSLVHPGTHVRPIQDRYQMTLVDFPIYTLLISLCTCIFRLIVLKFYFKWKYFLYDLTHCSDEVTDICTYSCFWLKLGKWILFSRHFLSLSYVVYVIVNVVVGSHKASEYLFNHEITY
jgi:hypothetical protein